MVHTNTLHVYDWVSSRLSVYTTAQRLKLADEVDSYYLNAVYCELHLLFSILLSRFRFRFRDFRSLILILLFGSTGREGGERIGDGQIRQVLLDICEARVAHAVPVKFVWRTLSYTGMHMLQNKQKKITKRISAVEVSCLFQNKKNKK